MKCERAESNNGAPIEIYICQQSWAPLGYNMISGSIFIQDFARVSDTGLDQHLSYHQSILVEAAHQHW